MATKEQILLAANTAEQKYGLQSGSLQKLAGIESTWGANLESGEASGPFQFTPGTAKDYNLDDPYDPDKSADAAARHLSDSLKQFGGDYRKAFAAYNAGRTGVQNRIDAHGDAWEQFLPEETKGYLDKFYTDNEYGPAFGGAAAYRPKPEQLATAQPMGGIGINETIGKQEADRDLHRGVINSVLDVPEEFTQWSQETNMAVAAMVQRHIDSGTFDDSYLDDDKIVEELTAGVPEENRKYILQGPNLESAKARRAQWDESSARMADMAGWGIDSFGTGMLSGMADPGNILAMIATAGSGTALKGLVQGMKNRRLAMIGIEGGLGAASNVGIEYAGQKYRPLATPQDLENAAWLGLAFGGLGGATARFNPQVRLDEGVSQYALATATGRGFTMEPGTGLVRVVEGEVIPPIKEIGYDAPRLEGRIIEGEYTEGLPPERGIPGRVALDGPSVREDSGAAVVLEGPNKGPDRDVDITPRGEPSAPEAPILKDEPFGENWQKPKFNEDGYLELPESDSFHKLTDYIKRHSKNADLITVLNRVISGMPKGKVKLRTLERGKMRVPASHAKHLRSMDWRGIALTRLSDGKVTVYLRGRSWGKGDGLNEETFIHELIHANAVMKYRAGLSGSGTASLNQAAQDLKQLHAVAKMHFQQRPVGDGVSRAFENPDELLAYGLTNRKVQEFLKTIPMQPGKKSLWDSFVKTLRGLLGIPDSEANAFTKLIDISATMLKKERQETIRKQRAKEVDEIIASYQVSEGMERDPAVRKFGIPGLFASMMLAKKPGRYIPGWGISREYKLMNAKVPSEIREFAAKLMGNKVGWNDHSVVSESVDDIQKALHGSWATKLSKALWYSGYDDWFKEMKTAGKFRAADYHYIAKDEFQIQVQDYIRGFNNPDGWHKAVIAAGEGVRKILSTDVLDNINNPSLSRGGSKRGLTQQILRDPETGEEVLTPALEKNLNYIPRKLHYTKIANMVNKIGVEGVQDFFAGARKAIKPDASAEECKKFGKWYYETFNEAHALAQENKFTDMVSGLDKNALKMSLMKNGGFSESEALGIVEDMFPAAPKKSAVANSNLKGRADILETFTTTMTAKDGSQVKVSLNDFVDTNLEQNLHGYFKRMSAAIGEAHLLDIYNDADWKRALNDLIKRDVGGEFIPEEVMAGWSRDLNLARDTLKGIPQEQSTGFTRSIDMMMKYNQIRLMGWAGLNQATETGNILGHMGYKATFRAVSELDGLFRDVKTGKAPTDLLDQIEMLTGGAGADFVSKSHLGADEHWVKNGGDTSRNRFLDWASTKMSRGADRMYKYNGMVGMMTQQQRTLAIGFINHWHQLATGRLKKTKWFTPNRLAVMGIDLNDFDKITEMFKKYTRTSKGDDGMVQSVDWDSWRKEDSQSMWRLLDALERETSRQVLQNDVASSSLIFDGVVGRAFFQFQRFMFTSWDKALMYNIHQRDLVAFQTFVHSGFVASMQYLARTHVAAMGMPEDKRRKFLEQRLSAQQIVANSFGRTAHASLVPQLVDTISPVPVFSGMRSTSDISSVFSSPVFQLLNTAVSTKKYLRNALSEDYQTTDRDIKATYNLLMLNNLPPMSILGNAIAGTFPSNERVDQ